MRSIASTGISPTGLGIAFLFCVAMPLTIWASLMEAPPVNDPYQSYFDNISWSISMVLLFPCVVALTFKYYQEIPELFSHLLETASGDPERQSQVDEFYVWLNRRFDSYWVTGIATTVTVGLSVIYFYQLIERQGDLDWITNGILFSSFSSQERGLTYVGFYAAIIQAVLIYWIINLVWRAVAFSWGLHEFFNKWNFPVAIEPLHPDRCCGLRRIGDIAMLLNLTLFLLGIYLSLKVMDKTLIQGLPLTADIGNPLMLSAYVILAPLLFFFPLASAKRRMNQAKQEFLLPIGQKCEALLDELATAGLDSKGLTALQAFAEFEQTRNRLLREIPVWPFDFRSMRAFVGIIVTPIVPIMLPFVMKLMFG